MTALEQQLTKALRVLSAQYEQAQQQHAAQVEALERHVAQLSGQVTHLARTTGRSPRRYAGAGPDAPAWARAGFWS